MDASVKKLVKAIQQGNRDIIREVINSEDNIISRFYKYTQSFPGYMAAIKCRQADSLLELIYCNAIDKSQLDFMLKCAISSAVDAYCKRRSKNYDDNLDAARKIVKILVDNGATPSNVDIAISYADEWMVKFLVDRGADYTSEGIMYKCMDNSMYLVIKNVISNDPNIVILGKTVLQHAIESNSPFLVSTLVKAGADVTITNSESHKRNAELAASKGNIKILRILINAGVDINSYTYYPAIYHAVRNGHLMMTRLLLKNGSRLFTDDDGESLIKYAVAVRIHNYDLTKLLLKYGATISGSHEKYITHINDSYNLHYRDYLIKNTKIIILLIKNGLNVNNDNISLRYLSKYNSIRVFKQLTKNIQDINDLERGYILDPMIEDNKRIKFMKYLISIGAIIEPEVQGKKMYDTLNILFKAVYHAADKKVKILLDSGANINASCDTYGTIMRKVYINNYLFYSNNSRYHINETKKVIRILIPYLLWSGIRDNSVRNTREYNKNMELVNIMTHMKEIKRICDIELNRMKGIIISQSRRITLYDFLSYEKDSDLLMLVNSSNVISNNRLNLFKRIIRNRKIELINKRKSIYTILERIGCNTDNTNRFYCLPFEIRFKILSHLTYEDLKYIMSK
ncbi:ankyrin repeat protein [Cheloniid poxvirus 1]|nr:ankyrin repeat protein [Cheloniid poxvirus 1]